MDRPAGIDLDHHTMVGILGCGQLTVLEKVALERSTRNRIERFAAGAEIGRGTEWERKFQRIDPELRLRWGYPEGPGEVLHEVRKLRGEEDPPAHWVVDRWVHQFKSWVPVLWICDADFTPPKPVCCNSWWWLQLSKADMQAAESSKEIVRKKREAADARQAQLRKEGEENLGAAIDSLSTKQMREFIEVEQAMATGEKIEAHGSDEVFLDRALATQKKHGAPVLPAGNSINPGMHPRRYVRQRR